MSADRLLPCELEGLLAGWPAALQALALETRAVVLEVAPGVRESVAFHSLCYARPGAPFGVIGGNACLISRRGEQLELAFLHGASLPDPDGLLEGAGKAKRRVPVRTREDLRQPAVADLIRAAARYQPTS